MRIGGGVVPSFVPTRESPRTPSFSNGKPDGARKSEESLMSDKALDSAVDVTDIPREVGKNQEDPFRSKEDGTMKRVSIGKTVISNEAASTRILDLDEERRIEAEAEAQLHAEVRKSMDVRANGSTRPALSRARSSSTPSSPASLAPKKKDERLSLTIPGSFE
jgi:hypothetical protein